MTKTYEDIALERAFAAKIEDDAAFLSFRNNVEKWVNSHKNSREFKAELTGDTLEITIMDIIGEDMFFGGGVSALSVKKALESNPNAKNINVLLDTPGGDVYDGVAIHSLLRRSNATVTVEIIGEASSAGSIIAMAASPGHLKMHVGTSIMVHRAWTGARGNSERFRSLADVLDVMDSGIMDIYQARNTKLSREDIEAKLKKETWMSASQAVEFGFADEIIQIVKNTPAPAPKKTETPKNMSEKETTYTIKLEQGVEVAGEKLSTEDLTEALTLLAQAKADRKAKIRAERQKTNVFQAGMGNPPLPFGGMSPK